ncbi:IS66 family insertion sequence element accessory protein TnpB, partial [Myxococcus sp. AS-1-15]|uniref:IS66 family insertion sequence element accessory protein TnpB n=1 Tax=Myxococcus sp. AS-1-15 TaxID=2874600 RepID=UPI001CBCC0D4
RRGFDGLSALVEQQLGQQLLKGDVFHFVGRCRRRAKVLHFDGTGLVLLTKRLFRGRFARPWSEEGAQAVELTVSELSLFLEGCELAGRWKLSPPAVDDKVLAIGGVDLILSSE